MRDFDERDVPRGCSGRGLPALDRGLLPVTCKSGRGGGKLGGGVDISKVRDCTPGVKGGSWNLNYQGVVAVSKWPTGLRNIQGSTDEDQTPN